MDLRSSVLEGECERELVCVCVCVCMRERENENEPGRLYTKCQMRLSLCVEITDDYYSF